MCVVFESVSSHITNAVRGNQAHMYLCVHCVVVSGLVFVKLVIFMYKRTSVCVQHIMLMQQLQLIGLDDDRRLNIKLQSTDRKHETHVVAVWNCVGF